MVMKKKNVQIKVKCPIDKKWIKTGNLNSHKLL